MCIDDQFAVDRDRSNRRRAGQAAVHRRALACVGGLSLAMLLVTAAGCRSDDSAARDQPDALDGSFEPGEFAQLPKPNSATALDDPVAEGQSFTQSFHVTDMTPDQVVGFYEPILAADGWQLSVPPQQTGTEDRQAQWTRGDETLQVAASVDSENGDDPEGAQLDLTLTTG